MLAMIGIVDCIFRRVGPPPVPLPFLCMGNGHFISVWSGRNGTKTSPFFLSPTVTALTLISQKVLIRNVYGSPDSRQNRNCNCLMASGDCLVTLIV